MSIGAVLVGIGALAVVVAYVVRPFRVRAASMELDRAIEAWVAQARDEQALSEEAGAGGGVQGSERPEKSVINFCPQCGRRVAADDRFCSACGARLGVGSA